MDHFVIWIKQVTAWLYVPIYQNQLFFVDYWSFVHCWTGFVVFAFLILLNYKPAWLWLLFFLTLYEIVEIAMLYFSLSIFNPETIKDQVTDIVVGMAGGGGSYLFLLGRRKVQMALYNKISPEAILTSVTLAFVWIGNTQYYLTATDSSGIFTDPRFFFWSAGGYIFLKVYAWLRQREKFQSRRILFYATIYIGLFLMISSFQYQKIDLPIPESGRKFLLFSMVLVYPLLAVWFCNVALFVFSRSARKLQAEPRLSVL